MSAGEFHVRSSHNPSGRTFPPFVVPAKDETAARALCSRNYLTLHSIEPYAEQPGEPKPRSYRFGPPVSDRDFEADYGNRPAEKSAKTGRFPDNLFLAALMSMIYLPFGLLVLFLWRDSDSD